MARTNTFIKSRNTPSSQEEYISSLDPLLRKNRGSSTLFGYETSNTPFIVPEGSRVSNPTGLQGFTQDQLTDYSQYLPQQMQQVGQDDGEDFRTDAASFSQKVFEGALTPVRQNQDGSVTLSNNVTVNPNTGEVIMPDGTRYEVPYPLKQNVDGSILMSDGTFRKSEQIQSTGDPLTDLIYAVFGGNLPITQSFMNYNPQIEPGSGYNYGTDIGASFAPAYLPMGGRVVKVLKDDGTRWGDISGHGGYGNSVLIQLDNGTYLRYSHLQDVPNFNEGDLISQGELVGITGDTGNVTGPHLDLEFYNQRFQLEDPDNFFKYVDPSQIFTPGQGVSEKDISEESKSERDQYLRDSGALQTREREMQSVPDEQPQVLGMQTRPVNNFNQMPVVQKLSTASNEVVKDLSQTAEQVGQKYNLPEAYVGEGGRPRTEENPYGHTNNKATGQILGNLIDSAATKAGLPEFGVSEFSAGNTTPNTGRIDSIQSKIAQGLSNIRNNLSDTARDIKDTFVQPVNAQDSEFNPSREINQKVNASLIEDKILGALENVRGVIKNNVYRPTAPVDDRVVGNELGMGDVLGTQAPLQSRVAVAQSKPETFQTSVPQSSTFKKSSSSSSSSKKSSSSSKSSSSKSSKSTQSPTQSVAPTQSKASTPKASTKSTSGFSSGVSSGNSSSKSSGGGGGGGSWGSTQSKPKSNTFQKAISKALTFLKRLF